MKIELSIEEAKVILNYIYGTQCITSAYPEMPKPEKLKEAIRTLTSEEVREKIHQMVSCKSVVLYINMIKMYQSLKPDYDDIMEFLIPYDNEIVSIKNIENTWYVNTL